MKLVPRERFESAGNSSPINTLFKLAMSETSCGPSTTAYPAILRFYHARVMFVVFFRDSNSFGKFFAASNNNPSMTLRPHGCNVTAAVRQVGVSRERLGPRWLARKPRMSVAVEGPSTTAYQPFSE